MTIVTCGGRRDMRHGSAFKKTQSFVMALSLHFHSPLHSTITPSQNWPESRRISVDYNLSSKKLNQWHWINVQCHWFIIQCRWINVQRHWINFASVLWHRKDGSSSHFERLFTISSAHQAKRPPFLFRHGACPYITRFQPQESKNIEPVDWLRNNPKTTK